MFVFTITTVIIILATTVLFFGPGITTQGIPIIIKLIDPSIAVGWSPHKLDVIVGVIAVISRLNARIRLFITWFQCSGLTRKRNNSLSSATWYARGELWFFGSLIGEWSLFFPSVCLGLLVRARPLVFDLIGSSNSDFPFDTQSRMHI